MLDQDSMYALSLLVQEYSLKQIVEALSVIASAEADELADMQMGDESRQFSLGAELLQQLSQRLK